MVVWKAFARFSSELFSLGIYQLPQRCTCSLWGPMLQEGLASTPQSPAASSRVSPFLVRIPTHPLYPGKGLPWQKLMFKFRLKCSSSHCVCFQTSSAMKWGPHVKGDPEPAAKWKGGGGTQEESQGRRREQCCWGAGQQQQSCEPAGLQIDLLLLLFWNFRLGSHHI